MKPVSPVIPGALIAETVIAKDQPPYLPLPARRIGEGTLLTRWVLSDEEKRLLARLGYCHLYQATGDNKRHATQVLVEPVLDADELLPPTDKIAYHEGGGWMRTRWWFERAELARVLVQGYVYLVIWHGQELIQPMVLDVDMASATASSAPRR